VYSVSFRLVVATSAIAKVGQTQSCALSGGRELVALALTAALAGVGVRLGRWVNVSPALPLLVFLRLLPAIRPIARAGETERWAKLNAQSLRGLKCSRLSRPSWRQRLDPVFDAYNARVWIAHKLLRDGALIRHATK
jgi:hypothetical protein